MLPETCMKKAEAMDRKQLNDWYENNVGYAPDREFGTPAEGIPLDEFKIQVAEMMFYHENPDKGQGAEQEWKRWFNGRSAVQVTMTPWKPVEGNSVCMAVPASYTHAQIRDIARMMIVGDIVEVRWQFGHPKDGKLEGNGRYVTIACARC